MIDINREKPDDDRPEQEELPQHLAPIGAKDIRTWSRMLENGWDIPKQWMDDVALRVYQFATDDTKSERAQSAAQKLLVQMVGQDRAAAMKMLDLTQKTEPQSVHNQQINIYLPDNGRQAGAAELTNGNGRH